MFNHNNKWLFGKRISNVSLLDIPVSIVSIDRRPIESLCWRWRGGGEGGGSEVQEVQVDAGYSSSASQNLLVRARVILNTSHKHKKWGSCRYSNRINNLEIPPFTYLI